MRERERERERERMRSRRRKRSGSCWKEIENGHVRKRFERE